MWHLTLKLTLNLFSKSDVVNININVNSFASTIWRLALRTAFLRVNENTLDLVQLRISKKSNTLTFGEMAESEAYLKAAGIATVSELCSYWDMKGPERFPGSSD